MKKIFIVSGICIILIVVVYLQFSKSKPADPRGSLYAGSATCIKCHGKLYDSYLHTAHYVASVPATEMYIHGSFAKDLNVFNVDAHQKIVMEKRDSGMYQSFYVNGTLKESHRFDIVFGGVKGESYLYWKNNELYQLPVSYFTKQHQWLLSPGYTEGSINFKRAIGTRCMECHSSYIGGFPQQTQQLNSAEQFDKKSLVVSVDCERCHGPAAEHVKFQTDNPQVRIAKFIVSYNNLPRARRLDMCGVCHSGNSSIMLRSTFGFKPGDTLANFKLAEFRNTQIDTGHLDVHGNQLQLLESSKCFINSQMDCATCHDTHQNQRGNTALYTQKCLNCHTTVNHNYCKMANTLNAQFIKSNCIQCHMPALVSKAIIASTTDKTSGDILVHTHHIAIYPQEVKKILAYVAK